ncbi:cystathionine gamma-synthase [Apiospora arundinis]
MQDPIGFSKPIVAFANKDPAILGALKGGYPRFIFHKDVHAVFNRCLEIYRTADIHSKSGVEEATRGLGCLVFPSITYATDSADYISRAVGVERDKIMIRRIDLANNRVADLDKDDAEGSKLGDVELYAVLYPEEHHDYAKRFWRISGTGISSRLAEDVLKENKAELEEQERNLEHDTARDKLRSGWTDHCILQHRIISLMQRDASSSTETSNHDCPTGCDDVYLYSTGMAAIYSLTKILRPWCGTEAVVFGFPYDSTLRVQQLFAEGCLFYGNGTSNELDQLKAYLEDQKALRHHKPQYVWCECASNPLVRTLDLDRVRRLADKYGFLVIVDDTIGTSANVNVLDVADVVVTSLSKSFNGRADAMGGSIVLNRQGRHYHKLHVLFTSPENAGYTNSQLLYYRDAKQIEFNSRNYLPRVAKMNENAARLVNMLTPLAGPNRPLQRIYYTRDDPNYRARMRQETTDFVPGYGGLFSLAFSSVGVARAFFDALDVCKGSSLGAEMTLCQPYIQTVFAKRKEWAAQYGLDETLVRCSIGLEDAEVLEKVFRAAMETAENAAADHP